MYDVAIMGSGPAGLTAALYSARANLSTVVITGDDFGGQIATTNDVENYPGFEAITGPDLSMRMRQQAEKFGAEFEIELITDIEVDGPPFKLIGRSGEYQALSVILANGASPKTLGIPGEQELWGRGVSFCATCDGAFFRDVPIAVVGGGDSAIQEALFLTRFGSKVIVIHRRDELRAGATLRDRAFANDKIEFLWDTVVTEIKGEAEVEALRVRNVKSGDESDISIGGVFVYVGHYPNTELLKGKVALDEDGYVSRIAGCTRACPASSWPAKPRTITSVRRSPRLVRGAKRRSRPRSTWRCSSRCSQPASRQRPPRAPRTPAPRCPRRCRTALCRSRRQGPLSRNSLPSRSTKVA